MCSTARLCVRVRDPSLMGGARRWCSLLLERADIDDAGAIAVAISGPGDAALVGGGRVGVVAPVDGRATRKQGVGLGGAAVERERAEPRVEWVIDGSQLVARGT